jgi:hypothetical protein|uniref:Uncharacterized protein n=1 Tax=Sipha flava TaxID=143950 RepID=A0A2S2QR73_9HEMI
MSRYTVYLLHGTKRAGARANSGPGASDMKRYTLLNRHSVALVRFRSIAYQPLCFRNIESISIIQGNETSVEISKYDFYLFSTCRPNLVDTRTHVRVESVPFTYFPRETGFAGGRSTCWYFMCVRVCACVVHTYPSYVRPHTRGSYESTSAFFKIAAAVIYYTHTRARA